MNLVIHTDSGCDRQEVPEVPMPLVHGWLRCPYGLSDGERRDRVSRCLASQVTSLQVGNVRG